MKDEVKINFIKELYKNIGNTCLVDGKIGSIRKQGKIAFLDLIDYTGKVQIVVKKEETGKYFSKVKDITVGSYVAIKGKVIKNNKKQIEIEASSIELLAKATLIISPNPYNINILNPKYATQFFNFPSIYLANPKRAAILKLKTDFIMGLHNYFIEKGFTLVEPPILTDKTLYHDENAVKAVVHGENVFLTQCATFELEALAMVYKKVYTISPAFRNEKGGSKRHLAEYTHAKAEVLLANLEDLMFLAGDSIYHGVKYMIEKGKKELNLLGVEINLKALNPKNHIRMTYNEALNITRRKGSTTEYGSSLTQKDEEILSKYTQNKYIWVMFPPFVSEGFPYKRKPDQKELSMVADLIAPHGAGEMVGVAEKISDPEELIENIIEKGKIKHIRRYWEYILLRFYGLPPHGGIGAAPERIIYGLLGLDHIRLTKPYPRYPDRKINFWDQQKSLNPWKNSKIEKLIRKYKIDKFVE